MDDGHTQINTYHQWRKKYPIVLLEKRKHSLIENPSSKSESDPVKYYLSKSLKAIGLKCT